MRVRTQNLQQYAREVPRKSVLVEEHSCLDLNAWRVQLQGAPEEDVEAATQESAQSPLPPVSGSRLCRNCECIQGTVFFQPIVRPNLPMFQINRPF